MSSWLVKNKIKKIYKSILQIENHLNRVEAGAQNEVDISRPYQS